MFFKNIDISMDYKNYQPQHLCFGGTSIFIANYGKIIDLVIFFP